LSPFISRLGDAMIISIAKGWHTAKYLREEFAVLSCGIFKTEKHGTFFAEIGAFWIAIVYDLSKTMLKS
jgi:hypothetical protein